MTDSQTHPTGDGCKGFKILKESLRDCNNMFHCEGFTGVISLRPISALLHAMSRLKTLLLVPDWPVTNACSRPIGQGGKQATQLYPLTLIRNVLVEAKTQWNCFHCNAKNNII